MALFPLFVDIEGKKCVVVGGGSVAERRICVLLDFGARITVVSPEISPSIKELKWKDKLVIIKKRYSSEDIEDAFLAIAATNQPDINEQVAIDGARMGIPVNIADNREKCSFMFPAVVRRGEIVVGISTSGGFPALSGRIRRKIEDTFPQYYGDMLEVLKEARDRAENISDTAARKELLKNIMDEVLFYENAVTMDQLKKRINKIFEENEL
ncbi:MAG TPA: bifunctional precorrin-2 dehydrogenase/sirohydrochlorin ferrochelatase [Clostridia bacterium]